MQNNTIMRNILLGLAVVGLTIVGCKKFVETDPPLTQANGENVYTSDATAIAVLTGIYAGMVRGVPSPNFSTGTRSFSLLCGLSADEYTLFTGASTEMLAFYQNALVANGSTNIGTDYWNSLYDFVFSVNSAIDGITKSNGLTEVTKRQLLGEAKFIRAFFYFYLVNLYGDVPLVITTDYKTNTNLARAPKADVYEQIKKDLIEAQDLLSSDYLDGKLQKYPGVAERVRPTKWSAKALLARTYLYTEDWLNAETHAGNVISNISLYDTVSLNTVFLKNSKEAIWQLQPVFTGRNTDDSRMFVVTTGFSNSTPVRLSDTLLNSFESEDNRKASGKWVNTVTISGSKYYYPFKYKDNSGSVSEYLMVLRLAEQYLIRAEARARRNNLSGAIADLDIIRNRAGLPLIANTNQGITQLALLDKILHERQVEFFSEWGQRWFDLKRTNTVDALMTVVTPQKANGAQWQSYKKLYPIPFIELQRGPNLIQTPGYQ